MRARPHRDRPEDLGARADEDAVLEASGGVCPGPRETPPRVTPC